MKFSKFFKRMKHNLKSIGRQFSPKVTPIPSSKLKKDSFMYLILEDLGPGWGKAVRGILKCFEDHRFIMGNGEVRISGRGDPDALLKELWKKRNGAKYKVIWFRYGLCSSILNGPKPSEFRGEVQRPQLRNA